MYNTLLVLFTLCIASIDTVLGTGCNQCVVDGRKIEGNSHFTHHKGCIEYTYCICNCNGGWECFGQHAIDHCRQNVSTGCYYCDVKGQRYNGHSYFKYRDGCYEYNCFCGCDGGWNCPSEKTVDICNTNTNTGCMYCDVKGQRYNGHSYFKYRDGCYVYNCLCKCDGGWNCPSEKTVDVCNTNTNTGCRYCNVDGQKKQGNSRFDLVRDCYLYSGCICQCDGGWTCAHTTGKYVCGTKRGKARYSSKKVTSVKKIGSSQK